MTIYVDPLTAYPQAAKGGAAYHFGSGKLSCHLATDGDLETLHQFAAHIGMRRSWFQQHKSVPHYDLTPSKRAAAVQAGAVEVSSRELVRLCRITSPFDYYTGIGSRDTPSDICATMTTIASYLARRGYWLRSGGAKGADLAFEAGADRFKEIYLPGFGEFDIKSRPNQVDLRGKWDEARAIAMRIHPAWSNLKGYARVLHIRNIFQVAGPTLDKPSRFVVYWAPERDGQVFGGTRTAVVYARELQIPTFNLAFGTDTFKAYLREQTDATR